MSGKNILLCALAVVVIIGLVYGAVWLDRFTDDAVGVSHGCCPGI